MPSHSSNRRAPSWVVLTFAATAAVLALLPWVRHHAYLRDFMDYGLVMSAVEQIEAGGRPYVDFATPLQCATYWANGAAVRLLGGTYQAMTWGNALLIVGSILVLVWLLRHRWTGWAAAALALAVVAGSASQHTIIWYNATGVLCAAVAIWAGALAPVLRRATVALHAAAAAALFLGGANKLNFHFVALAFFAGWAIRSGLRREAGWGRVAATLGFAVVFGVLTPIAGELLWTGASPAAWWHNVIGLPSGRSGYLLRLAEPGAYLRPFHDYYGPLALPPVGLCGLLLVAAATAVCAASVRTWLDRFLLFAAGLLAAGATAAILATNHEIGYVTIASAIVLAVGLHLGFATDRLRPRHAVLMLVVPSLILGAISLWSAWQGQRSQFGHSSAPREDYRDGAAIGPEFGYFRGTLMPPEFAESLAVAASLVPPAEADGRHAVFYGLGLEFLECVWPAMKTRGSPLWMAAGTSCGPAETGLVAGHLGDPAKVRTVLSSDPWEQWPPACALQLSFAFNRRACGGQMHAYLRRGAGEPIGNPMWLLNLLGGNLHPAYVELDSASVLLSTKDERHFLGTTRTASILRLAAPSNRLAGTVVARRAPGAPPGPVSAEFVIRYTRDAVPDLAWSRTLTLPDGVDEVTADYQIDARQQALRFSVTIPPECTGLVAAGWLGPRILHSIASTEPPPSLYPDAAPARFAPAEETRPALPATWSPDSVLLRGGTVSGDHFELPAGGELWLRADRPLAELLGRVRLTTDPASARLPFVRLLWCKGGRIEIITQASLRESDRQLELRAWSAEAEGWFGVLIDPGPGTPAALVNIDSVRLSE